MTEPVQLEPAAQRELLDAWRRSIAVHVQLEATEIEAQVIAGKPT